MRPRPRRSRPTARPSSASGGSSVERLPIASKKPTTASSPSRACRRASGEAQEPRTRSSVCTKSSSGGLRRRPCCRRPIRRQCCSGRCSPLVKSTCARLTVGRPSPPHNKAINRLTSPPDSVLSKCRRSRQQIPTQFATAPTAKLEESVVAHREALKEWTRERAPLQWALTQNDLGVALFSLGWRESGTAKFEEAVTVYREALKEQTRERVPLAWAQTQSNLGNALSSLGERETGTAKLEEAIAAYREAVKEWTRERAPLD